MPVGQFQRRSKLAPKVIDSEVPSGGFCANRVWTSNVCFKLWAGGRVYQDLKRRISLWTANFSSEPTKWKEDGRLLQFLKPFVLHLDQLIDLHRYQHIDSLLSFLLPLESISHNSGLPGRTGKILVFEIQVWVWNLSLKFKVGSVFQPTQSLLFKFDMYT